MRKEIFESDDEIREILYNYLVTIHGEHDKKWDKCLSIERTIYNIKHSGLIKKSQLDWAEEYTERAKDEKNVYYAMKAIEIYKKETERLERRCAIHEHVEKTKKRF